MSVKPKTSNQDMELFERIRQLLDDGTVAEDITLPLVAGVDLGTSNIQVHVFDGETRPVTSRFEWDDAVRDGMVVDFLEAREQLRAMVESIQDDLGDDYPLEHAAVGYPPGTEAWVESNVVEDIGLDIVEEVDEPTAAAEAMDVDQGAIVDIGGGTTGISVIEDGDVVYSADEATGGHHLSLVLSGGRDMDFDDAENFKHENPLEEYVGIVQPVIEKMAGIIGDELTGYPDVETVYLVGGTVIPAGFEDIISDQLSKDVVKPDEPILVTPVGIGRRGAAKLSQRGS